MRYVTWVALLGAVGCRSTVALDDPPPDSGTATRTTTATVTSTATDTATGTATADTGATDTATSSATGTDTTTGTATSDTGATDTASASATSTDTATSDTGATDTGTTGCWDTDLGTATGTDLAYGTTAGAPDRLRAGCGNVDGPERTFLWTAPVAGRWHASVQGSATDVVVSVRSATCDAVLDCGGADGTAAPWALVTAAEGESVVLTVEAPATRAYVLHVVPVPDAEPSCTDALDEDEDGATDCGDTDCADDPACAIGPGDVDADGDGSTADLDCDDGDGGVHPGADEACNDRDDDCDGAVDEGTRVRFHPDADHDGFGDAAVTVEACAAPEDHVLDDRDCNDADPAVFPGAAERCDPAQVDEDCNGIADAQDPGVIDAVAVYTDLDADGVGAAAYAVVCEVPAGSVTVSGDCDDHDTHVNPTATESCNDRDDNCDGRTDEGLRTRYYPDADGDTVGANAGAVEACSQPAGFVTTTGDCDDTRDVIHPGATERCDSMGRDEDCNGLANDEDPGVQGTLVFYVDADGDTWGAPEAPVRACAMDPGTVTEARDCDDGDPDIHPGAVERCDAADRDEDCNGAIDDADTLPLDQVPTYADTDADGHGDPNDVTLACEVPAGRVAVNDDCDDADAAVSPDGAETCNGLDDDCNGTPDDGLAVVPWYLDGDRDGFGDAAVMVDSCATWGPYGYVDRLEPTFCDADRERWPGHPETCNLVDDDCDGDVDEDGQTEWYADNDVDGHGDADHHQLACGAPAGFVALGDDCDDTAPGVYPGADERCDTASVDEDCNGLANDGDPGIVDGIAYNLDLDHDGHAGATTAEACEPPQDAVFLARDCDDDDPAVHPGAVETCNATDDDCDTTVDEGVQASYYRDQDLDSYGAAGTSAVLACTAPYGYVANNLDCNDTNGAVKPFATETCNSVDDDCDASVDEGVRSVYFRDQDGDTYGTSTVTPTTACSAPNGYVANFADCNDASSAIKPGATETCNTVDDDCDGSVDEGVLTTYYRDSDHDTYGSATSATVQACSAPSTLYVTNGLDCNDGSASTKPGATETCNSVDDDCDGSTDEGVIVTYYRDQDGDGYGATATTATGCSAPTGYRAMGGDCNDNSPTVSPGRTESCNGVDDDCDGVIDDNVGTRYYRDADGDTYGNPNVSVVSCSSSAPTGYRTNNTDCDDTRGNIAPGALEGSTNTCNDAVDNDCDTLVDRYDMSCCPFVSACG